MVISSLVEETSVTSFSSSPDQTLSLNPSVATRRISLCLSLSSGCSLLHGMMDSLEGSLEKLGVGGQVGEGSVRGTAFGKLGQLPRSVEVMTLCRLCVDHFLVPQEEKRRVSQAVPSRSVSWNA